MIPFPAKEITIDPAKLDNVKGVMESTFRLIMFSRHHMADDLLNAYIDQTTDFRELLSIRNAQMEAQNEEEAKNYAQLLRVAVDFITSEIKNQINFETEVQLFQLFRIISPESHASHPNSYRRDFVQVGKHLCPPPEQVGGLVSEVFYQMSQIENPILKAIYFHHEMIRIHPFSDGNGRAIRMAKNWMLMYELYPPIYISNSEEKLEYIHSLETSFYWLSRNSPTWNPHISNFFEQELNRLLLNANKIYERVFKAGKLRVK